MKLAIPITIAILALGGCNEPYLEYPNIAYNNSDECSRAQLISRIQDVEIKSNNLVDATKTQNSALQRYFTHEDASQEPPTKRLNSAMQAYAVSKREYEQALVTLAWCY